MGAIPKLPLEEFLDSAGDPTGFIVQYKDLQFIDSEYAAGLGKCDPGYRAVMVPPGFMSAEFGYFQTYHTASGAINNREWAIKRLIEEYETWTMNNAADPWPREKWRNRVVVQ